MEEQPGIGFFQKNPQVCLVLQGFLYKMCTRTSKRGGQFMEKVEKAVEGL